MFTRARSMPCFTISRITSGEELAGPRVHTTLVRSMNHYQEKRRGGPAGGGLFDDSLFADGAQRGRGQATYLQREDDS